MKTLQNNIKYWLSSDLYPAYLYAKEIMRFHAKSFFFATKFMPQEKRWATYAVYSFCRYVDNIVDNPRNRTIQDIIKELDLVRGELQNAYLFGESEHPSIKSFISAAKLYKIPLEYPMDLIDGVQMDITINRYNTFDELYVFCYKVAAVVGLMMTYIMGFKDSNTLFYAEKMGVAMQLTNILRDIQEDKNMQRIYLPIDEIKSYGLEESDFFNENFNLQFRDFMKFQVERVRLFYQDSITGVALLDAESRFSIYAAGNIYSSILRKIEERGLNPFLGRVFVPNTEKISIMLSEFIKRNILQMSNVNSKS